MALYEYSHLSLIGTTLYIYMSALPFGVGIFITFNKELPCLLFYVDSCILIDKAFTEAFLYVIGKSNIM